MNIPDEAVEAAARALWAHGEMPELEWCQLCRVSKQVSLDEARAALEAAATHMLAGAWEEGVEAKSEHPDPAIPYRPAP